MWNEKHSKVFIFEQNLWKKKIFSQTLFQCIFFILKKNLAKTHNNSLHKLPKTKMGNSCEHRIVRQNILNDLTPWDQITPMTIPLHINCYPQRIAFGIKTTLYAKPTAIKANTKTSLIFTSTVFILRKSQIPSHSIIAH